MDVIFLLNYVILDEGRRLEVYASLSGCKELISIWILYLILSGLKWVVPYSCQPNTTRLLSVPRGLGLVNPLH